MEYETRTALDNDGNIEADGYIIPPRLNVIYPDDLSHWETVWQNTLANE